MTAIAGLPGEVYSPLKDFFSQLVPLRRDEGVMPGNPGLLHRPLSISNTPKKAKEKAPEGAFPATLFLDVDVHLVGNLDDCSPVSATRGRGGSTGTAAHAGQEEIEEKNEDHDSQDYSDDQAAASASARITVPWVINYRSHKSTTLIC